MISLRAFTLAALAMAGAPPGTAAPSHCAVGERVVFSCAVGAKTVSVCAAGDLSSTGGTLRYRFGLMGQPEITYPPEGAWRDVTRAGRWIFSGGGGAWLAFNRAPFRYVVYTAIGRGWVTVERHLGQGQARLLHQRRGRSSGAAAAIGLR